MTLQNNQPVFASGAPTAVFLYDVGQDRTVTRKGSVTYYEPKTWSEMDHCVKAGNFCYRYENKYVMMSAKDAKRLNLGNPHLLESFETFKELNRGDAFLGPRHNKKLGALSHGAPAAKKVTQASPKPVVTTASALNTNPVSIQKQTTDTANNTPATTVDANPKIVAPLNNQAFDLKIADHIPTQQTNENSKTDNAWTAKALDLSQSVSKQDPVAGRLLTLGVHVFGEKAEPALKRLIRHAFPLVGGIGIPA